MRRFLPSVLDCLDNFFLSFGIASAAVRSSSSSSSTRSRKLEQHCETLTKLKLANFRPSTSTSPARSCSLRLQLV